MAGSAEILQEYLVKLGFVTDTLGVKKMDNALGAVSKKVFGVGAAVASMAVATEIAVSVFSSQMEKLYYASKLSDSSVTKLKSLAFAGKSVGLMGDQLGDAVHNMAQAIRLNPGMKQLIESFGVKVTGRDISDVALDTLKSLSRLDEYVGAQWANQLFGMDADTYHLLVATPGALDKLSAAQKTNIDLYKQYGMNADEAAEQSVKYMNSLRDLENRMGILKDVVLKDLAPAFQVLNKELVNGLDYLTKWFANKDNVANKIMNLGGKGNKLYDDKDKKLVQQLANGVKAIGNPNAASSKQTFKRLLYPDGANKDPDYRRHIDYGKKVNDWMKGAGKYFHKEYWDSPPPARVSASSPGVAGNSLSALNRKYGLPAGTLEAVMQQESGGKVGAVSNTGALGRFQTMPGTAKNPGFGLSSWNPLDTNNNADADHAGAYLAALVKKHGSLELGLAAYNAGSGNVDKYKGVPPFAETQNYTKSILGSIENTRLGASGSGNGGVTINQENNFNVTGNDANSTSQAIIAGQSRVNGDLVRNLSTGVK